MLLQILCISFLFFTFFWEEHHVVISHYLNKLFQVKVFDWAETHDSDSESEDGGDDESEIEADEADEEGEDEGEEKDSGNEGESAAPTNANANANLRHRIVECAEDTAAIEKATREIQQKLHESLATTTL
jgi:hypothetical protein